mmetsp:Transcript_105187/g.279989  ORF Transcript_105187/g.279989 Transcript_105187/m.279989 type:complete len:202 (-) Transcript_105187:845-1450(-)
MLSSSSRSTSLWWTGRSGASSRPASARPATRVRARTTRTASLWCTRGGSRECSALSLRLTTATSASTWRGACLQTCWRARSRCPGRPARRPPAGTCRGAPPSSRACRTSGRPAPCGTSTGSRSAWAARGSLRSGRGRSSRSRRISGRIPSGRPRWRSTSTTSRRSTRSTRTSRSATRRCAPGCTSTGGPPSRRTPGCASSS